jgi:hypothetical protein
MQRENIRETKHQRHIQFERVGMEILSRWSEDICTATKKGESM